MIKKIVLVAILSLCCMGGCDEDRHCRSSNPSNDPIVTPVPGAAGLILIGITGLLAVRRRLK